MPPAPPPARVPAPIPYQGSKRRLATRLLALLPRDAGVLHEPFCGSAALSLAALSVEAVERVVLNDANAPLMALWSRLVSDPEALAADYAALWWAQQGCSREFYDDRRREFNATRRPELLLFLLARCAKSAVRYNARGEFNQSPDNRRLGAHPERMAARVRGAARLLGGRCALSADDYRVALRAAGPDDVSYLDPPYQGVSAARDRRYHAGLDLAGFVAALEQANRARLSYLVSFDGRTGARRHGEELPAHLALARIEVEAGRSSQATLLGRVERTVESLYLSPALVERLGGPAECARRLASADAERRQPGCRAR